MLFTVDVEDWFTNGRSIKIPSWDCYDLRIEENTMKILDLLDLYNCKATFFILGWIAYKKPSLVREISERGHEIASHGFAHQLVYSQKHSEFRQDIKRSKILLEDIIGNQVNGYRAPCFSVTNWAYEILSEEGYTYSSSLVPHTYHPLYSKVETLQIKNPFFKVGMNFYEFPLPAYRVWKLKIPWGGGGYFRSLPYQVYRYGLNKITKTNQSFIFYIHPYEIDQMLNEVNDAGIKSFAGGYGIKGTYLKLGKLLSEYQFKSVRDKFPFITKSNQKDLKRVIV